MSQRNGDDTMFERGLTDVIPTQKHPETVSELSIVQQRKKLFKDWIPCSAQSIHITIGEIFLVITSNVKQTIKSAIDIALLPPFNINAYIYT